MFFELIVNKQSIPTDFLRKIVNLGAKKHPKLFLKSFGKLILRLHFR